MIRMHLDIIQAEDVYFGCLPGVSCVVTVGHIKEGFIEEKIEKIEYKRVSSPRRIGDPVTERSEIARQLS